MYPVHFRTDDLDATFQRVAATPGVEVLQEPMSQPWGIRGRGGPRSRRQPASHRAGLVPSLVREDRYGDHDK